MLEVLINNKIFIIFMVKVVVDVYVVLSVVYGDVDCKIYEIVIGIDGNIKLIICYGVGGLIMVELMIMNILFEEEFWYFWVNWVNNKIEVGCGVNYGVGVFF